MLVIIILIITEINTVNTSVSYFFATLHNGPTMSSFNVFV